MAIQNLTSSAALCGLNERLLREMAQVFLQRWIKDKKLILFDKKNLNDDCYVPMLRLYVYRYEAQGPRRSRFILRMCKALSGRPPVLDPPPLNPKY